jgi:hypothetical protein
MKRLNGMLTIVAALGLAANVFAHDPAPAAAFDEWFKDKTMRVDYFHTGDIDEEIISLDGVVSDGAWAGSRTRLVDESKWGKYWYEVADKETKRVLYSRGFASIYGEWETTEEAKEIHQTFHESLRFPWPKKPVTVTLSKRDGKNEFHKIWSADIDPNSRFVNPADLAPAGKVWPVFQSGPPSQKVDLVVLGDGYTAAEMEKFHSDTKRLVAKLFATEPFKRRKSDFNVWAIDLPSEKSGIHQPRTKDDRRNPLGSAYNIFDSERYVLTYDNKRLRDVAAAAPYEFLEILVNEKQYGGGGIYNFQATSSVDTGFAEYVFVHEFGHHFAGLADEYYTSPVSYATGGTSFPEPWEANVTALHDPKNVKWGDLIEKGTPIPTPWKKEEFEKHSRTAQEKRAKLRESGVPESEIDKLFREQQEFETKLLSTMQYSGKVGAFEGASYEPKGLYRPEADCIMFTRDEVGFCRVCTRAIEQVIDMYTR